MQHYFINHNAGELTMQAVLSAVKATFNAMKSRLNSKCFGDVYILERPLLRVQLQLCIPNISLHPSLADIQQSINTIANKASLLPWHV